MKLCVSSSYIVILTIIDGSTFAEESFFNTIVTVKPIHVKKTSRLENAWTFAQSQSGKQLINY